MSSSSPRLGLAYLQPAQAQKHVTHNEALQRLDAAVQLCLQGFAETEPPGSPLAGEMHGLGAAPAGAWAGQGGALAYWDGAAWLFLAPAEGWRAWGLAEQELRVFRGGAWQPLLDGVDRLGIGTAADATNRLSVASDASLFSHAGADHRMVLNKAAAGDTASLLFQSGWTGHAEIGLAGDTGFSLRTSADGQSWQSVLRADPGAQEITLAPAGTDRMVLGDAGLQLDVPLTGAAVQADPLDGDANRLMTVGAFGLGADTPPLIADFTAPLRPGIYRYLEASAPGAPGSGAAWQGTAIVARSHVDGRVVVHATRHSSGNPRSWTGTRSGDTGAIAWVEIYQSSNILGTVSQSGGVPTGAVIESGANANGAYVRFADGTQICTHQTNASASGDTTWQYPAAFDVATFPPRVTASPRSGSPRIGVIGPGSLGSSAGFGVYDLSGARQGDSTDLCATGRWF